MRYGGFISPRKRRSDQEWSRARIVGKLEVTTPFAYCSSGGGGDVFYS